MTVLVHVFGLIAIRAEVVDWHERRAGRRPLSLAFALVMGVTVLLVTALHAIEAAIWGFAYLVLDALPDARSAMLYSLSAMTTYGHADIYLRPQWQLMGALESLNGVVLFGVTTAILFSIIDSIPKTRSRSGRHP